MPHFTLDSPNQNPNSGWVPVTEFKSLNRIVESTGIKKTANYSGHYYEIIGKEIYNFSALHRFVRQVIAFSVLFFSAGLLWLYKPVRDLWMKDHLSRRYGKPLAGETDVFIENKRLYYKNPQFLTEPFEVNGKSIRFALIQRAGESTLRVVTGGHDKFKISSISLYKTLFALLKSDFDSAVSVISVLKNKKQFFDYLLEETDSNSLRFFEFDSATSCKIFELFMENDFPINTSHLIKLLEWSREACPELSEKIESFYPQYKNAIDPVTLLPIEIMHNIFSYLNLHEVTLLPFVSSNWHAITNTLLKERIYREEAFTSKHWHQIFGSDEIFYKDPEVELSSLSNDLLRQYVLKNTVTENLFGVSEGKEEKFLLVSVPELLKKIFIKFWPRISTTSDVPCQLDGNTDWILFPVDYFLEVIKYFQWEIEDSFYQKIFSAETNSKQLTITDDEVIPFEGILDLKFSPDVRISLSITYRLGALEIDQSLNNEDLSIKFVEEDLEDGLAKLELKGQAGMILKAAKTLIYKPKAKGFDSLIFRTSYNSGDWAIKKHEYTILPIKII